jgi:glycosyltransferase involved in cell wall biosynthesis
MIDVLYTTYGDPNSRSNAAGGYYVGMALEELGLRVQKHELSPFTVGEKIRYGPLKLAYRLIGKDFKVTFAPGVRKRKIQIIERTAHEVGARLVISNTPVGVVGLQGKIRYVMYCDAPYAGFAEMGHYLSKCPASVLRQALDMDQEAAIGADAVYYFSKWSADRAVAAYGVDRKKIKVVAPGANIEFVPKEKANLTKSRGKTCRLLFFGQDWERKGGPIAIRIVQLLRDKGLDVELIICGPTKVSRKIVESHSVTLLEPIRKDASSERDRLINLFQSIDYLLLPTRADIFPSAIREACAFGVPSITTTVGGVEDLLANGQEAILMDVQSPPEEYVPRILENFENESERLRLRRASRDAYENRMLWTQSLNTIIADLRSRNLL